MSFQSRMTWRRRSGRPRRGRRRRSIACGLRSMPARFQPSSPGARTRSCAWTILPLTTSTRCRPSTSAASSTSPARRWKASVRMVCVLRRTPPGSRASIRSLPMKTPCAPTRTFSPVTGGYAPSESLTMKSSTRPTSVPAGLSTGLRSSCVTINRRLSRMCLGWSMLPSLTRPLFTSPRSLTACDTSAGLARIAPEMSLRAERYRAELRDLEEWEPYLKKHSGLPGPRANLELVAAVAEEADPDRLWRFSASNDEFLALCGTAGLGRVALLEPETVMTWLRELASDPRWRVREGVAMALQRLGRENMSRLIAEMKVWSRGDAFVQRAVVAGLCDPPILKTNGDTVEVLAILDAITGMLASSTDRKHEGFRVLRQALGYGWSVAAAAAPQNATPYLDNWLRSTDKDVAWG